VIVYEYFEPDDEGQGDLGAAPGWPRRHFATTGIGRPLGKSRGVGMHAVSLVIFISAEEGPPSRSRRR